MATPEELDYICKKAMAKVIEHLQDNRPLIGDIIYPYIIEAYALGMKSMVTVLESAIIKRDVGV